MSDTAVVQAVVEEVPGEVLVRQRDVVAPRAVAELRDLRRGGHELGLRPRNVGDAGLPEQVLVVVDDRAADDARKAVELALVHALRDRVRDELRLGRGVVRVVEPLLRVQRLEHALGAEAGQVGARLVADVERIRSRVVRGVRRALDVPRDDRVLDLRAGLVLPRLDQLGDDVLLVGPERRLRELERDAVEGGAARDADPRDSRCIPGQGACDRQPDCDSCGPLQEIAPVVPLGLRLGGGRQRFLAAFTQIVHSNLLLSIGLARCSGRSAYPSLTCVQGRQAARFYAHVCRDFNLAPRRL